MGIIKRITLEKKESLEIAKRTEELVKVACKKVQVDYNTDWRIS